MLLAGRAAPARQHVCCGWRHGCDFLGRSLCAERRPSGRLPGASRGVCGSAAAAAAPAAAGTAAAAGPQLLAPSAEALGCLASIFASHLRAGDCYCLYGSVGAGKSTFSRAFIRTAADDELLAVPSPTFLLQNTYDEHDGPPVHHFDFYRLLSDRDFGRLSLQASFSGAVCLVEWPERLQAVGSLPDERLAVHIEVVCAEVGGAASDEGAPLAPQHPAAVAQCSTDSDTGDFTDVRPRMVTLVPHGEYWTLKVQRIVEYIDTNRGTLDGLAVRSPC